MTNNLFDYSVTAPDSRYNAIRDNETPEENRTRSCMEALWHKYQPYADSHFKQQIQIHLDSRFWEMYLACTLLNNSIRISSKDAGPDILVEHANGRIWVEAVAPTSGNKSNPDRVPPMQPGVVAEVPEDKIILRYRGAIKEKYNNKYSKYVESGMIAPKDSYIVAVNGCKIPSAIMETGTPRIIKAVFPIGKRQITIDKRLGIVDYDGYQSRGWIKRISGADVRTDIFLNPKYANLSAVLYSHVNAGNCPHEMGGDFVLVHNPLATNPIPHGFLKVGREYVCTQNQGSYSINAIDNSRA